MANSEFEIIKNWLNNNLLSLNLDKTTYIEINEGQEQINYHNLTITGITKANHVKYLGIIIDEKLSWEEQITELTKKIRKTMYKFIVLRKVLNIQHLKSTYHALVESHLNYGITAWGSAQDSKLKKLIVAHKKVLKIIYCKPARFPSNELYKISNVHTIHQLFIKASIFDIFINQTNIRTIAHSYPTRWRQNLSLQQEVVRTTYMQRQCEYVGIKYYNKLPAEIKQVHNGKLFKKKIGKWIKDNIQINTD
jgi:hypothetical protein